MPFYSLLSPVNDESFTSWVTRCDLKLSPRRFSSKEINDYFRLNLDRFPILDPDFSVDTLTSTTVTDTFKIDPQTLLRFFRPRSTWVIPFSDKQHACTSCLMESLKEKRCYVFLKSWRYVARPICPVHQCLLSPLTHKQRSSIKAFPSTTSTTNKSSLSSQNLKILVLLALQIQRHICRLENSTNKRALKIIAGFRFLIELFLSGGEHRGLACYLYSKATPQREALKHSSARALMLIGALDTSPFERMCALILTGYITGAFSHQDTHAFELISNEHSSLYSCSAYEIGHYSQVFPPDAYFTILRRLEKLRKLFPSRNYRDFLKGFDK